MRGLALPRLTALRLFAAGVVVVFHLDQWQVASLPASLSELGFVGVAFFFTLSGFVLAWGTAPALPSRRFYRHRFARIWPSHMVMLVVAALVPVVAATRGWEVALPNVFLVQAWWTDPETAFGMNGVAWTLSCEAFFYACFPLTVRLLRVTPRPLHWIAALLALAASAYAGLQDPGLAEHLPLLRFSEFFLGVVGGLALREGWRPRIPPVAAAALLILGLAISTRLPFPLPNVIMAVPFLVVLLSAAGLDLRDKPGWLRSRALIFGGEASFALYLVHELAIINLSWLEAPAWTQALIMVAVSVSGAVMLHLAVERPFNKLLRGRSTSVALAPPSELADRAPDEGAQPARGRGAGLPPDGRSPADDPV
jgi:peptidoglycan/LPS O-acetylase OafA/YrhL